MALTDIARTDALTAAPDTPVGDVAAAMRDRNEEFAVVLREGRPLGLLSAATIGREVGAGDVDVASRSAADLLSGDPVTVRRSAGRAALVSLFERTGARRAIVTDETDEYAGVVDLDATVVDYGRELAAVLDLFEGR